MTANFLGREKGYQNVTGFGEGNTSLAEAFSPAATYGERIDKLMGEIAAMGFTAIDLWTAHCSPDWATPQHIDGLLKACAKHKLEIVSFAGGMKNDLEMIDRTCKLAADLGIQYLGMGCGALPDKTEEVVEILKRHRVKLAFENHPKEVTPDIVLDKISHGKYPEIGIAFDSGWWGTHNYPVLDAWEMLKEHTFLVHCKDVQAAGGHVAAFWGEGCVDIRRFMKSLKASRFSGWISLEYEPIDRDPTEECTKFLETAKQWWAED